MQRNPRAEQALTVVMIGYLIFQVWNYLFTDGVGDEGTFFDIGMGLFRKYHDGTYSFLTQENSIGYGVLYWNIYLFSLQLAYWASLGNSQWILPIKILAMVATFAVPCALYSERFFNRIARPPVAAYLALALYFMFPMNWWTGKISGPETFSLAVAFVGLGLILSTDRRKTLLGAVLIGAGIGIKMTAIPVMVFAFVLLALMEREKKWVLTLAVVTVGSFLATNPFLLFSPESYVFINNGPDERGSIYSHLKDTILSDRFEVDYVFSGGLVYWSLPPLSLLGLLYLLGRRAPWRVTAAFAIAVVSCLAMFCYGGRVLGWYWFPTIMLLPACFLWVRLQNKKEYGIFLLALALGIPNSVSFIYYGAKMKTDRVQMQEQAPKIFAEIAACFEQQPPVDMVTDLYDTQDSVVLTPEFYQKINIRPEQKAPYDIFFIWSDVANARRDMEKARYAVIVGPRTQYFHWSRHAFLNEINKTLIPEAECPFWDGRGTVLFFNKL